jgi:hypothetical protein
MDHLLRKLLFWVLQLDEGLRLSQRALELLNLNSA